MSKIETLTSYTEIKQKSGADKSQKGMVIADRDYASFSTEDQVVINLNFSVTLTEEGKKAFRLKIDGNETYETADWEFTNIQGGTSAQVTFHSPLMEGLKIDAEKVGVRVERYPSPSSVQAHLNNEVGNPASWASNAFQDSIKLEEYEVPYSTFPNIGTIANRAKIIDQSKTLKVSMGTERIAFNSISLLSDEFGPNGEQVFGIDSKDSRVRIVGGWSSSWPGYGNPLLSSQDGDYIETSFYGTGLNVVLGWSNAGDLRATVDNGSESGPVYAISSSVLNNRNYAPNIIVSVVSGLSFGFHTVKLKAASNNVAVLGVEILSESTQLSISKGTGWSGVTRQELLNQVAKNYKPTGMGNNGGRVRAYLKDGDIGQVYTEVGTPLYLTNTNHDNEEQIRKINFREFGANRADDFSTVGAGNSDRAFTLDDGITTLVGNDVGTVTYEEETIGNATTDSFLTITFIGTGLDAVMRSETKDPGGKVQLYIDGVDRGAVPSTDSKIRVVTLCSGLPYGAHTVKIDHNGEWFAVAAFIPYQPKKPVLPMDAVEICDYNVMADFVANVTASILDVSKGVLRKTVTRETIYKGAGWGITITPDLSPVGFVTETTDAGNSLIQEMFGLGFDFRFYGDTNRSSSVSVTVNVC